jgi:AcrR family transcriptional regulator
MTSTVTATKGELTRQAILDAAEGLILSQGYHGTSMRQIASRANIAVGGIYNHFSGKDAIFEALLERHQPYSEIVSGFSKLQGESTFELLESAARTFIDVVLEDPIFIHLGFIDLQEFGGDTIARLAFRIIQGFLALIGPLVESGEIRQDLPLPVLVRSFGGLMVFYALSEAVGFVDGSPRFEFPFDTDVDWVGGMIDIFLNGASRKAQP